MKKLLLIAALGCSMAHAEFQDGNRLLAKMTSGSSVEDMVSLGYVMGVADTLTGITLCFPMGASAGQIQDIVKSSLQNNPETRHLPADLLIARILKPHFPCAKKGNSV